MENLPIWREKRDMKEKQHKAQPSRKRGRYIIQQKEKEGKGPQGEAL